MVSRAFTPTDSVREISSDYPFCPTWIGSLCIQVGYINLRVDIDDCKMNFPPKWGILTDAVTIAMRVCNDNRKSNNAALGALHDADDTFEAIKCCDRGGVNFNSGTFDQRASFINIRNEIHLMMINRGVRSDHYYE